MLQLLASTPALAIASAFGFGLLTGSFLNVVILRLPPRLQWQWERDSRELLELEPPTDAPPAPPGIVVERSRCPQCGHPLAAWLLTSYDWRAALPTDARRDAMAHRLFERRKIDQARG